MKIAFTIICFLFVANVTLAQSNIGTRAKMTQSFADTLRQNILKAITDKYDIELWYQSPVAPDGQLVKPLISKQVSNNDINYNPLLQQMKRLIVEAPAWTPALEGNGEQVSGNASFHIKIYRGNVTIEEWLEDR